LAPSPSRRAPRFASSEPPTQFASDASRSVTDRARTDSAYEQQMDSNPQSERLAGVSGPVQPPSSPQVWREAPLPSVFGTASVPQSPGRHRPPPAPVVSFTPSRAAPRIVRRL
jgi:hypothetical protein